VIWLIALAAGLVWAPIGFFLWRWTDKNLSPRWKALAWPAWIKYLATLPAAWFAVTVAIFLPWWTFLLIFNGPPAVPASFDEQMRSSFLLLPTAVPSGALILGYQIKSFFESRREAK
jgi:hypothetical protein